jgi:hypothetical protein
LQGGTAFSNTPPATGSPGALLGSTQSVYPVFPAATNASSRGGVITSDVITSGSTFTIGAEAPIPRDNIQVMTFVSGGVDGNGLPPAGAGQVIVRRADPAQAGSFPPSTSTVIEVPAHPVPAPAPTK